ncbi:FAD-dependent monooxygenase [Actinocrispum sp. NPDC049592]|uniref:FAD-dependent oxidoreductase n=1 Tax=Actinocrispum sp. NPDC049592 TaxID=3154835 RepID=UPI00342F0CD0
MSYDTDVLVVGTGPAGGAAALLLATYGIRTLAVNKYGWVANTPRSHITNQRTMEVLRDLGIEQEALALGTPQELMGDTVLCTSIAGAEIGRITSWGTGARSATEYLAASPSPMIDLPQTYLEPILVSNAAARGAKVRMDTEFRSFEQDADGVTATLFDRVRNDEYTIRAKYLIGADGGRSKVAELAGLPISGQTGKAGSMNITFTADLSRYVAHRPSVLYWVMRPGAGTGGIGMGLVRMVRPWNEWLLVWGYDIEQEPPEVTTEEATAIVRDLVGDPDLPVEITSTSLWTVNHNYATEYANGRVFCAGDAVHRHPPSNGLGSNTSIQDSYNLAWKLAMVIRGQAGPALLDTYSRERAPIGKQVVDRANLSREEFGPIFAALGISDDTDAAGIEAGMAAVLAEDAEGAKRRRELEAAVELKNYEFNAHGVELDQRYVSSAVLDPVVEMHPDDHELFHRPSARPGAKLPHVWLVGRDGRRVSTLDLVGHGRFTLVTGLAGTAWVTAAKIVSQELRVDLAVARIGDIGARDAYGDWSRVAGLPEVGTLLVRPDGYIAWRRDDDENAQPELRAAMQRILATEPALTR